MDELDGNPAFDEAQDAASPADARPPSVQLAHEVANFLGALDLRVEFLMGDAACMSAQRDTLLTLKRLSREVSLTFGKLQDALSEEAAARGAPSREDWRPY